MKNLLIVLSIATMLATYPLMRVTRALDRIRQEAMPMPAEPLTENELRDICCWRGCTHESDMIFMGAGLCDEHWTTANSTFKTAYEYALPRVLPEAAEVMRRTHAANGAAQ